MRDAKAARSASETKTGSAADRGTLFHIRNLYNHRNVAKNVNSSFNPLVDLLGFTTDGFTALLAMKLCGIDKLSELPSDFPTTSDAK
ncbi:hypothetical protein KUTeg_022450 [Tegillarca granosa]|uniref:Uncharacterized protein n=1 Tax=Tegillarca granosa TaxID=220873 RepID=A0ABQ9E938_TEGGR|nr:hypothetical protein KUTeg_022450 [Tegillarca granosa]